jgi:hypothetical protein
MPLPGRVAPDPHPPVPNMLQSPHQPNIPGEVGHPELGNAVLPGPQDLAGAPEFQILRSHQETVRGSGKSVEPCLRLG